MSRPLRIEYPGAFYHLTSRGNARECIFLDDRDREIFLAALAATVARFAWRLNAYCLMGNHYHLLVETPQPNLSAGMHWLNGVYTQRFNRRHDRVGHVLQGRFNAIVVDRDNYFLELARYIVLNPVRADLVAWPGAWRWSSYRATAGDRPAPIWLHVEAIHAHFCNGAVPATTRYQQFVAAGVGQPSPWAGLRGQVVLGSRGFVERLAPKLVSKRKTKATPRAQRLAHRPPLELILSQSKSSGDRREHDVMIREAHVRHEYTCAEIARHLGLHYTQVYRILKNPSGSGLKLTQE